MFYCLFICFIFGGMPGLCYFPSDQSQLCLIFYCKNYLGIKIFEKSPRYFVLINNLDILVRLWSMISLA